MGEIYQTKSAEADIQHYYVDLFVSNTTS